MLNLFKIQFQVTDFDAEDGAEPLYSFEVGADTVADLINGVCEELLKFHSFGRSLAIAETEGKMDKPYWSRAYYEVRDSEGDFITGGSSGSRTEYYANFFSFGISDLLSVLREAEQVSNYTGLEDYYSSKIYELLDFYDFRREPDQLADDRSELIGKLEALIPMENYLKRSIVYRLDRKEQAEQRARWNRSKVERERKLKETRERRTQTIEEKNKKMRERAEAKPGSDAKPSRRRFWIFGARD